MRTIIPAVFALVLTSSLAAGEVDKMCVLEELPTVTQPMPELSRIFARAEQASADPYTAPMGAVEVVVARIGSDGRVEMSCVDTEEGARAFFTAPFAREKRTHEEQ